MCRVQREKTWHSGRRGCILWPCQGQNGNPGFVVYPASDYCWDYLKSVFGEAIHEMSATGTLRVEAINNANHVFTAHGSHSDLQKAVDNWLQGSVNLTGSAPIGC